MSRYVMASFKATCFGLALFVLLVMASVNAHAETTVANSDSRSSTTLHFKRGGRDSGRDASNAVETEDRYGALETGGDRSTRTRNTPDKAGLSAGSTSQAVIANDFWIYDADVLLFADDDGDGYY